MCRMRKKDLFFRITHLLRTLSAPDSLVAGEQSAPDFCHPNCAPVALEIHMSDKVIFPDGEDGVLVVTHMQREFLCDKDCRHLTLSSPYTRKSKKRNAAIGALWRLNTALNGMVRFTKAFSVGCISRADGFAGKAFRRMAPILSFKRVTFSIFPTDLFRFCGINANACVFDTAVRVAAKRPNAEIEVSVDATKCCIRGYNWWHYGRPEAERIKLVRWNRDLVTPGARPIEE